jgi:hypothetical protein
MSPDRIVVVLACATAVLSVAVGLHGAVPLLEEWKDEYGPVSHSAREAAAASSVGLDSRVWSQLRSHVRTGDRFAVVASGVERFDVRNYAAYELLPAIQVSDPVRASIVVYYKTEPPRGVRCEPVAPYMCIVRPTNS